MKMSGRILYGLQKERDAAVQANAPLRERIRELTAKVKELETENSRNIRKIETMAAELRELRNKEVERVAVMAWVSSVIGDDAETVAAGHIRAERERLRGCIESKNFAQFDDLLPPGAGRPGSGCRGGAGAQKQGARGDSTP